MTDIDQSQEQREIKEEKLEHKARQQIEPGIVIGLLVVLVSSIGFYNDPSYEALIGILGGITTIFTFVSKERVRDKWLLVGILFVSAVVGIFYVRWVTDPEEIIIVGIFYDGTKDQEGDEYVVIRNEDMRAVQLEGWILHDSQSNHVYTFPRYEMQPNQECRIFTNEDHSEWCGFNFRNGGSGVWDNTGGDMATLRNAEGIMIDSSIDLIMTPEGAVVQPSPEAAKILTPTLPVDDDLECIPRDTPRVIGVVEGVIDGRTIEVELGDGSIVRVRYLGLNTIVEGQPLFKQAVEINKELVLGKTVTLVEDEGGRDADGVLLRFVFVDDTFVNRQLIQSGYAQADGNGSCMDDFIAIMEAAFESDVGFSGMKAEIYGDPFSDTPPAGYYNEVNDEIYHIEITKVFYDGEMGTHEPDEYVEIRNDDVEAIQLKGWTLSDESDHIFMFPIFKIEPGQTCRIYTNEEQPDWCGFNYKSKSAIWGNNGDCAILRDGEGVIIDKTCYP